MGGEDSMMKRSNSFLIANTAMLLAATLAFFGKEVPEAVYLVASAYILGRGAQKVGLGVALAKDPNSKLSDNIGELK